MVFMNTQQQQRLLTADIQLSHSLPERAPRRCLKRLQLCNSLRGSAANGQHQLAKNCATATYKNA
eukprot:12258-Heterococcus_DN1.PRE.3